MTSGLLGSRRERKIGIYRTVKSKGGNFVVKYCMNLSDEKKETAIKIALESKGNVRKRKIAVPLLMILGIVIIFSSIFLFINVDGLYDFYTESDKNVDGSIKALKNVTGIGKNSKVFSIFDKYGTKTVKTIEDVVGLIGG